MSYRIALGLCLVLLFVWSIPGTIALRALLLLAALAALARAGGLRHLTDEAMKAARPLAIVVTLTVWFMLQAAIVSIETGWALDELRGQWLPALLALIIGFMLAVAARRHSKAYESQLATLIVIALALLTAAVLAHSSWYWLHLGGLGRQISGGKLEMSFAFNLLLAFLTVDLFCRATCRAPILQLPIAAVAAIFALAFLAAYLAGARNGVLGILFLSVSAVSLFVFDQRRRLGTRRTILAAAAIVLALSAFGFAHYESDPRWRTFAETVGIAWDIDRHTAWIDAGTRGYPTLEDGTEAEASAYIRISFIHAGMRLIAENPLGYGYGRNAFEHALQQQHPAAQLGHAHSGWIDLGVSGGWPALALWAALLASLMWRGWQALFRDGNPLGLVLFFLATGYAGRMVLDSVNKDHMLQMFFFLSGVLLVLTSAPPQADKA